MYRYYLKTDWQPNWTEVTKEQFVMAERQAGFRGWNDTEPCTAGFSGGGVSGKISIENRDQEQSELP